MTKKEYEKLCELVASWEFPDSASGSECVGLASAAEATIMAFDLAQRDELALHRQWRIMDVAQPRGFPRLSSDEFSSWAEALEDLWDEIGYEAVVDLLEEDTLVERLRPTAEHIYALEIDHAQAAL